ncbi:MAG: aminoacyl-histidine dipeptidase [Oscillospiraceae bacterium]
MRPLEKLEPKAVFTYFEDLCAIPHGSTDTKRISDYCVDFAKQRGLEYHQDAANNVIIIKPATAGYEQAAPLIVQGHLDMVCEKTPESTIDFTKDGLQLAIDGDWVYAQGTTLGGDDGIAVAMALAILDAKDLSHPRIEAVFTVDEEIGMLGATAIDVSLLQGRKLLNIDSEMEGVFTVSCCGGVCAECVLPIGRESARGETLVVTVGGLKGGHSGAEIDKHGANANQLMGRLLDGAAQKTSLRLISANGGLKDNAIPRESVAELLAEDPQAVLAVAETMEKAFRNEYRTGDPDVFVRVERRPVRVAMVLPKQDTARVITLLLNLPGGIQEMSADLPGLVQTSLNLGILTTGETAVSASFCVRSSVATQKEMLVRRITSLVELLGGQVKLVGDYPAWEFNPDSELRQLMVDIFTEQYGHAPRVEAVHAGLECGIFSGKLAGLDCVSYGPDLMQIHTVRERMSIVSVQRTWALTVEILKRSK